MRRRQAFHALTLAEEERRVNQLRAETHKPEPIEHRCSLCNREFSSAQGLLVHTGMKHR